MKARVCDGPGVFIAGVRLVVEVSEIDRSLGTKGIQILERICQADDYVPGSPPINNGNRNPTMPHFYLAPKQDEFDKIPELQVCIAEALYDAEAILSNPAAFKAEEIRTLWDQIVSNLERAWAITGRSEDELAR